MVEVLTPQTPALTAEQQDKILAMVKNYASYTHSLKRRVKSGEMSEKSRLEASRRADERMRTQLQAI